MTHGDAQISKRLEELNQRINESLKRANRDASDFTLIAVTKRQPLSHLESAYGLGLRHFGESLIQEGILKVKALPEDIHWHFIGHLQKNKVRRCLQAFEYIHSVDSLSLLERIDLIAAEERVCPKIFLQINYALDPDKYGLHPEALPTLLEATLEKSHIDCVGLMGIPPLSAEGSDIDAYFQGMAELRDSLKARFPNWPGLLSMGMSADFDKAIQAGSHFIRIGSLLFGEREL